MTVKKTANLRSVELKFEVPGSPEQVWQAIATGPGVSSWFVPTEVDERVGGSVVFHLGPGMDSSGNVTVWEPPHRFGYEEPDWSPGAAPLGTEFIVEASAGGSCVVRLVHSLMTSCDDWDDQLDEFETGWRDFFEVLKLYLKRFQGQRCSSVRVLQAVSVPEPEAWTLVTQLLGLREVTRGQRWKTRPPAPTLGGTIEASGIGKTPYGLLACLDAPVPGIALLGVATWAGKVHVSLSIYCYGTGADTVVAKIEPLWQRWAKEQLPVSQES
jgi:uncharacterized protein YndB with AHSA1/START domain